MQSSPVELSIVFPCLNEADTIGECVKQAHEAIRVSGLIGEVVVADNGSTDGSQEIARGLGAIVMPAPQRGYGNAYLAGLKASRGKWILMADSDGTYSMEAAPALLDLMRKDGCDFVLGSRMAGNILPGAMPFTHRYIGVPFLTWLLNFVSGTHCSDAHSGLRGMTREAYYAMNLKTGGMEFASEMILNAARARLKMGETPITYYPRMGKSKLRSIPDGIRHVKFIVRNSPPGRVLAPALFVVGGLLTMAVKLGDAGRGASAMTSSVKPVRVGIIGIGKMGILHSVILNALSGVRVAALCDNQRMLTMLGSKALRDVHFYTDAAEMHRREALDAVVITTPIPTHARLAEELLTVRPVGVFAEKPLAANGADAARVAELARRTGITTMVGFQKRYNSAYKAGAELLAQGALGKLLFFRGHSFSSDILAPASGWRFRPGSGGALLEFGVHLVDLIAWYFGAPADITAVLKSIYTPSDDAAHVSFGYDTGVAGHIDVSWSVPGYRIIENRLEVFGTKGKMTVTDDYVEFETAEPVQLMGFPRAFPAGRHTLYQQAFNDPCEFLYGEAEFCRQDEAFVRAVRGAGEVRPSFEDALVVNTIIDRINQVAQRVSG